MAEKLIKLKRFYPIAIGAGLGFLYYIFIGCNSGSCPITSNPWSSILYGSIFGALFVSKPKTKIEGEKNE